MVRARTAKDPIGAGAAINGVVTVPARQRVIAIASEELIEPRAACEGVVSVFAIKQIVLIASINGVVSIAAINGVGASIAVDDVIAGVAEDVVAERISGAAAHARHQVEVFNVVGELITVNERQYRVKTVDRLLHNDIAEIIDIIGIVANATDHRVGARAAIQRIRAIASVEGIVSAIAAQNLVVAGDPDNAVISGSAGTDVTEVGAAVLIVFRKICHADVRRDLCAVGEGDGHVLRDMII